MTTATPDYVSWETGDDVESLTLEIPMPLPSLANRSLRRGNWYADYKTRTRQKRAVAFALAPYRSLGLPATAELTRIAPRQLDSDNWVSSAKSIRDAVARWIGCVVDPKGKAPDDEAAGITWTYGQEKAPRPRFQALRIRIVWDPKVAKRPVNGAKPGVVEPRPPWVPRQGEAPQKALRGRPRASTAWSTELARAEKLARALLRVERMAARYGYEQCVESKPLEFMTARQRAINLGASGQMLTLATARGWDEYERKEGKR